MKRTHFNNEALVMPKFDQVIKIEVDVNSIFEKLMDTFPVDYKHAEMLSHAVIGSAVNNGGLTYIYNALNGYTNDIDFAIGDIVMCTEVSRRSIEMAVTEDPNVKPPIGYTTVEIGECEVIEIDLYSTNKLRVKFMQNKYRSEEMEESTGWVNHKNCTRIPQ